MRWWVRGSVWIGVGGLLLLSGPVLGRPLVLRGTGVPFGAVLGAVGVAILGWDYWKGRKGRS